MKKVILTALTLALTLTSCNKAELDEANMTIDTLEQRITAYGNLADGLRADLAAASGDIETLISQLAEATSEIQSLNQTVAMNNNDIAALNSVIADYETAIQEAAAADLAAAQAAADSAAADAALIASGQVLFAFDNGSQVFKADGSPVLLNYEGQITDSVIESHEGYVQKMLDIYGGIVDVWTTILLG